MRSCFSPIYFLSNTFKHSHNFVELHFPDWCAGIIFIPYALLLLLLNPEEEGDSVQVVFEYDVIVHCILYDKMFLFVRVPIFL